MPILIRLFFQWATKQLLLQFGKKIGIKTFRKGLLCLGKKYFNYVLKMKISRNGKEIPLERWIEEAPFKELKDYFRKFEVEITRDETSSLQTPIKNKYDIDRNRYDLEKKRYEIDKHAPNKKINDWYTLNRHQRNVLPKAEP